MHIRASLIIATAILPLAGFAQAAYPDKPISLIVAYGAKGSTDVTARAIAPIIARKLGPDAKVEVVNKAGAGGEFGFAMVAEAAPDGYTIGFINTPNVITIPIERQARYTLDKLDPLANIVDDPSVWTVLAAAPQNTLPALIAAAKAAPNKFTAGSTGVGSDDHLAILKAQKASDTKFVHVPFASSEVNHAAMLAGKISICGENLGEAIRMSQTDPIRILGVMSAKRWDAAPDVPTFKEQGANVIMASMRGIAAPKGLPPDIREKLVKAILDAAADPEFVALAGDPKSYQPLRVLGSDDFAKELKDGEAEFRALWKDDPWLK